MREWLEDALRLLPELELRARFGGFGIYAEGTMFGILQTGRVYLKGATRAARSSARHPTTPHPTTTQA